MKQDKNSNTVNTVKAAMNSRKFFENNLFIKLEKSQQKNGNVLFRDVKAYLTYYKKYLKTGEWFPLSCFLFYIFLHIKRK